MIAGLGTDLCKIQRIQDAVTRSGEHFLHHFLTAKELEEYRSSGEHPSYCAGRWAAKEALSKALGCGIGASCAFTEIQVLRNDAGKPEMTLSGKAAQTAASLGVERIHVSISHEQEIAIAAVILEKVSQ